MINLLFLVSVAALLCKNLGHNFGRVHCYISTSVKIIISDTIRASK